MSAGKCHIRFDNVLPLLFASGFNSDMSVSDSPCSVIWNDSKIKNRGKHKLEMKSDRGRISWVLQSLSFIFLTLVIEGQHRVFLQCNINLAWLPLSLHVTSLCIPLDRYEQCQVPVQGELWGC